MNSAQVWALVGITTTFNALIGLCIYAAWILFKDIKKQRERKRNFHKEINNTFN